MEQRVNEIRSEWKKDSEARRKEFFSDFDSKSEALNREFVSFRVRPSTAPLAQSTAMLSSGRSQIESHSDSQRTIQATYTVSHTPEKIASTLGKIVEKHIECATSNVNDALKFLQTALKDAHGKLSWGIALKQIATDALRSSQTRLGALSREYQNANKHCLADGDIPEFKEKVHQCVQPFLGKVKNITPDPRKAVTFEINITTAYGDKTHRTQLT
ncbi:hypothetical protein [Endozoicomonas atrinae]|uniref:hypothetical protein n=1 Tax=Endozoicomonas atrinae TaxID=1333660 RepID=UPI003B00D34A